MTPITYLRSFGQTEKELKFMKIVEKFWQYINKTDLQCFIDACDLVLKKEQKQVILTLCMIEMWMIYQTLKRYFEIVVKANNKELTPSEKENFHSFAEFNPQDRKVSHCYFCEFPINSREINSFDTPMKSCSRLDFVIRKEYHFLKNIFNKKKLLIWNI